MESGNPVIISTGDPRPSDLPTCPFRVSMHRVVKPFLLVCSLVVGGSGVRADDGDDDRLREQFTHVVRPFLQQYCLECHGTSKQEAKLDLRGYTTASSVARDMGHWEIILERLTSDEMPPEDAEERPSASTRQAVIRWIRQMRSREARRNAGDPGRVLARRLSNAEYDYTIHDLTGVDMRPTREFPVDPANAAGFSNSGESLAMSPGLLKKYLGAARHVADHLVLTPAGFRFAPHPVVTETDRDKYCVHRVVDFYRRQPIDYADYFFAAWRYRERERLKIRSLSLADVAATENISPKYLATVWSILTDGRDDADPLVGLRQMWGQLPQQPAEARERCRRMAEYVKRERRRLVVPVDKSPTSGLKKGLQPTIMWLNRQIAHNRRRGRLPAADGTPETTRRIAAISRFCSVFPDTFFVSERGRMFLDPKARNKGRLLSAGFHLMVGYFRDDQPLYDLILDDAGQRQLDALWRELDLVTRAPLRQFRDFIYFERAESTRYLTAPEFDFARSEDDDITSPKKMDRVARLFIARAKRDGIGAAGREVLEAYFQKMNSHVRQVERDAADAAPRHLDALVQFAERAWRRPLGPVERQSLLSFYRRLREHEQLSHEDAIRDALVSVLMSPRFSYRITPPPAGNKIEPLSDLDLASRLSYFLWSSLPDADLMARARAGDLRDVEVLKAQTRRMLDDSRVRRLAVEFGGNWLGYRQFEQHNGVDRNRFPQFNDELRQAMFEEPVRFFVDLVHRNGSIIEFVSADHTLVNSVLAEHYGMTSVSVPAGQWVRVDDARRYGRGGMLPMSVFLTRNSPGRRTSPVKRGYWVVRRMLGQHIPAPPPEVPRVAFRRGATGRVNAPPGS